MWNWPGRSLPKRILTGMRVERLAHGGCLIVATETPLPDDIDETRSRFLRLDEALRPAFLSREATSEQARHARVALPRTPAA